MPPISTLPGITSAFVNTSRLRQHVLSCGREDGEPLLFLHGNFSAATFWEEVMLALAAHPKPPILWIRGDSDLVVADRSMFDLAVLGQLGYVPNWPGPTVAPPQPMLGQTREVLNQYGAAGGHYREIVLADCAHAPHLEKPQEWVAAFLAFVSKRPSLPPP